MRFSASSRPMRMAVGTRSRGKEPDESWVQKIWSNVDYLLFVRTKYRQPSQPIPFTVHCPSYLHIFMFMFSCGHNGWNGKKKRRILTKMSSFLVAGLMTFGFCFIFLLFLLLWSPLNFIFIVKCLTFYYTPSNRSTNVWYKMCTVLEIYPCLIDFFL